MAGTLVGIWRRSCFISMKLISEPFDVLAFRESARADVGMFCFCPVADTSDSFRSDLRFLLFKREVLALVWGIKRGYLKRVLQVWPELKGGSGWESIPLTINKAKVSKHRSKFITDINNIHRL